MLLGSRERMRCAFKLHNTTAAVVGNGTGVNRRLADEAVRAVDCGIG